MSRCYECQESIKSGLLCGSCDEEKQRSERWVIDQDVFHAEDDSRRQAAMTVSEALNTGDTAEAIDPNATAEIVYDANAPRPDDQDWLSSHVSDVESGSFDVSAFAESFKAAQGQDSSDRMPLGL